MEPRPFGAQFLKTNAADDITKLKAYAFPGFPPAAGPGPKPKPKASRSTGGFEEGVEKLSPRQPEEHFIGGPGEGERKGLIMKSRTNRSGDLGTPTPRPPEGPCPLRSGSVIILIDAFQQGRRDPAHLVLEEKPVSHKHRYLILNAGRKSAR